MYLSAKGHQCRTAVNGREALDLLEEQWVDVIISDFVMPVYSGLDLLNEILRRFPERSAAIIMITGHAEAEDAQQAYDLGAKWVLQKPIRPSVLQELIRSLEPAAVSD